MIWLREARFRRDQQGFTLPELMTTIAILGILIAIGVIVVLALLERWRVIAAANQFASDLRTVHQRSTNQLTDWRVVFMPDGAPIASCSSSDYCVLKLKGPYSEGSATSPEVAGSLIPRELPRGTKINSVTFDADCTNGGLAAVVTPSECSKTRTLEFNTNGTVRTLRPGQSGTVRISSTDGDPYLDIVFLAPTSRIKIED